MDWTLVWFTPSVLADLSRAVTTGEISKIPHNSPMRDLTQWESSSTLILPGSSVAEYADLSTPLDETRVLDSWRVFGVPMSVSLITAGGVTALTAPA